MRLRVERAKGQFPQRRERFLGPMQMEAPAAARTGRDTAQEVGHDVDLRALAASLPGAWRSSLLARIGGAQIKLLRMDGRAYPDETHDAPEALLVLEGCCRLTVDGRPEPIEAGHLRLVPAGTRHGVDAGSHGLLLIVDLAPHRDSP